MGFTTDKAFAEFCGVSSSAIYKARKAGKIRKNGDGEYDPVDAVNKRYIMALSPKSRAQRGLEPDPDAPEIILTEKDKLEAEKLKAEIKFKNSQTLKNNLAHEKDKKNLVPVELVSIWMGHFATGIRNNFLQIGTRVARGDVKIRNRIEREIKKAIEKTIVNAAAELRKETEKLLEGWHDEAADGE